MELITWNKTLVGYFYYSENNELDPLTFSDSLLILKNEDFRYLAELFVRGNRPFAVLLAKPFVRMILSRG
jgi:hypothetical protein